MNIPDYLSYFYRQGQPLFEVLSDLDEPVAENILRNDVQWRGEGTYLKYRKVQEQYLRRKFIERGGQPERQYPIYMILGDSPSGPHSLEQEYDHKLILPLSIFKPEQISFTYPDSLYKVPLDDLGRLYCEIDPKPNVYKIEDLEELITRYKVYDYNNHYVEAQVWADAPLKEIPNKKGFR